MTIEELPARAFYSERERKVAERRLLLEAERGRLRVAHRVTPVIHRLPLPHSGRDRTVRQKRAA